MRCCYCQQQRHKLIDAHTFVAQALPPRKIIFSSYGQVDPPTTAVRVPAIATRRRTIVQKAGKRLLPRAMSNGEIRKKVRRLLLL